MRVLVAIPHYFDLGRVAGPTPGHGSLSGAAAPRVEALDGVRGRAPPALRGASGRH